MSNLNVKVIAAIVPAVVVVVGAIGYFGLSSYSAGKAEKELKNYLYDNRLESYVSWRSLSSSPFGGTITVKDIVLESKRNIPLDLSIEKFVITNFKDKKQRMSADMSFKGVRATDPESDYAKSYNRNIFGLFLYPSGKTQVEPYNLNVSWDYRGDKETLTAQFEVDLPNLFLTNLKLDLEDVKELKSALLLTETHDFLDILPNIPRWAVWSNDRAVSDSVRSAKQITLKELDFSYKDQGYLQRVNLLEQRYNITPTDLAGNIDKQRKQLLKEEYEERHTQCVKEYDSAYKNAKKACTAVIGTLYAQEKGFKVSAKPEGRVRMDDFERLYGKKRERNSFIERMNLDVKTY
ncbi:MAG: hypothetical protein GX673_10145 [Gammaproteobacteria bacterium]|nr:hypothetical protein [Gammaproteobacteria bacterium]